ncbi:hypothetical protein AciPR4_1396 [Terriglobus saanensis SP1PR4]|uniref:Uncharacterized protein n=1 Tax=Terriglobus saanensis (strain ATCC BAA-1853 / DSM 23119 / SP1PR4) TaxID=401053 RepID=E8V0S8_TERSS|nr:hypothetical protein AciPR4_1396 [Terriglobus saanensis SP1PR4]
MEVIRRMRAVLVTQLTPEKSGTAGKKDGKILRKLPEESRCIRVAEREDHAIADV